MHSMKRNKALGSSWLSPEILVQHSDPAIYDALADVLNTAMTRGVPPHWNTLYLTSIFKKGDPHDAGNYRGISVMSFIPKVFALA